MPLKFIPAAATIESYKALNPHYYYTYEVLGDYYAAIGERDNAIKNWEIALTKPIGRLAEKERVEEKIDENR